MMKFMFSWLQTGVFYFGHEQYLVEKFNYIDPLGHVVYKMLQFVFGELHKRNNLNNQCKTAFTVSGSQSYRGADYLTMPVQAFALNKFQYRIGYKILHVLLL